MLVWLALAMEVAVKMPMPPPDTNAIMQKVQAQGMERLVHVVGSRLQTEITAAPYLPWDKLRYKKAPLDLSHEEWWLITKLGRQGLQRSIPLLDKNGKNLTYALPDEAL